MDLSIASLMNVENDLPPAFQFRVKFSTAENSDSAFQEVSGIGSEMTTEEYVEGGENRFVHNLPKTITHPKLVLKRGIAQGSSPLVSWCKSVLENDFIMAISPMELIISLLNAKGQPCRSWSFVNVYPVNWEVDSFNSTKNEVAIEKIELRYSYSERIL